MLNREFEFTGLSINEQENVNGGALAGALAGAILGGCTGLVIGTGAIISNRCSNPGGVLWRWYTVGALSGAAIGCYTPV